MEYNLKPRVAKLIIRAERDDRARICFLSQVSLHL